MDKIHDSRAWCIMNTINVQNTFGLTFQGSTCASHLQCLMPNAQNSYAYLAQKSGDKNCIDLVGITSTPFMVGEHAP